jgi:hypothetical protein
MHITQPFRAVNRDRGMVFLGKLFDSAYQGVGDREGRVNAE